MRILTHHLALLYTTDSKLKSDSHLSKKKYVICLTESLSKMMKNVFWFISKALVVLKIFKFASWLFGHVEKTAWLQTEG